ncbi:hypothetical protein [Streptomyces sp. YGL11-2]|uniref:hypothetical protein n=1 Tax=Streptomyces sp. YGL11-2 TaxID=3414028 RepID=UPI003CF99798
MGAFRTVGLLGQGGTGRVLLGGAPDGRQATWLGFGNDAYWSASASAPRSCRLDVRDGDLVVRVYLNGTRRPACQAEAQDVTQTALTAMPPRENRSGAEGVTPCALC